MIRLNRLQKKRLEFSVLCSLIIITRGFDLATTYMLTPDLAYESNLFITFFGFGWKGFILIQLLLSIAVIGANYYSIFRSKIKYPKEPGLSFNEFQLHYMFGKGVKSQRFLRRLLGVFKVNLTFIGYLLPRMLILFSTAIVIVHTLLYFGIRIPYNYIYTFYGILLFSVVLFNKLYLRAHYRVYNSLTSEEELAKLN